MDKYQYIESGLDNVFIVGIKPIIDDDGDEVITIHHIAALHAEIARGIISRDGQIDGAELKFLRTEMGMTQTELAKNVDCDGQTIGRWERDEYSIPKLAETVIRGLAGERLVKAFDRNLEHLMRSVKAETSEPEINIQANAEGYSLLDAA